LPYKREYTIAESLRAPKQNLYFLLSLFTLNAAEKASAALSVSGMLTGGLQSEAITRPRVFSFYHSSPAK
jgi:hypothetical protein